MDFRSKTSAHLVAYGRRHGFKRKTPGTLPTKQGDLKRIGEGYIKKVEEVDIENVVWGFPKHVEKSFHKAWEPRRISECQVLNPTSI